MRPLKFRVWHLNDKCFLTPNENSPEGKIQPWCLLSFYGEVIGNADNQGAFVDTQQSNYIIQQYTGFRDADGIEIYEGDIIEDEDKRKRLVRWCEEGLWEAAPIDKDYCVGFDINNESYTQCNGYDDAALSMVGGLWNGPIKIVGNMFENPELLK